MLKRSPSLFVLAALAIVPGLHAEVKLPAVISDHMVLQKGMAVPIWGWADQGEEVKVTFGKQTKSATPGADGRWMVKLDALKPGAPETLTVQGKNTLTVTDVVVGEVWLGSGQSNMALSVSRALNPEVEIAAAVKHPEIRLYVEGSNASSTPEKIGKGKWEISSPENIGHFSACLYFFGRELQKEVGGNFGLIESAVGGTPIESWIDADVQQKVPELQGDRDAMRNGGAPVDPAVAKERFQNAKAAWKANAAKAQAAGEKPPKAPRDPALIATKKGNMGGLFNGKIAPLIPYGIRGALWYQGEANSDPDRAPFYKILLPLLVTDWRARWGQGDFPMAWAQLPNYNITGRDWPMMREAQLQTLKLKNTGMGINIDIGEEKNIHPANKQEAGRRLALWALGTVYDKKVPSTSGPLPAGHEVQKNEIVLSFKHADGGLKAKDGELKGFTIAGDDMKFVPAQAKINGSKVVVSSPEVAKPAAARYSWASWPDGNLYNGAGLPASPFRTDTGDIHRKK